MILIILGLIISILLIVLTKVPFKIVALIDLLFLCILAYLFDPQIALNRHAAYTDLVRFFCELDIIKDYTFIDALFSLKYPFDYEYTGLCINNIVLLLCSKIGNNHILPAFSCFVYYFVLFITLDKILQDCKANKSIKIIVMIASFGFFNYVSVICNIRNPIAFMIGICVLYWDLVQHTNIFFCMIVYILIIFIHPVAILILVFRICAFIINKYMSKIFGIMLIVFILLVPYILSALKSISFRNNYIISLVNRLVAYAGGQEDLQTYGNNTLLIITICMGMLFLFTIVIINIFNEQKKYKKFIEVCALMFIVWIGSYFFNIHMFYRMSMLISICLVLMIPVAFFSVQRKYKLSKKDGTFTEIKKQVAIYYIYYLFLIGILAVHCYYYFGTINYQLLNLGK